MDAYAAERPGARVVVQHGHSPAPAKTHGRDVLDRDELRTLLRRAAVVVTHGGTATIAEARREGHLPIVVARDPELGEHVDDHQIGLVARLDASGLTRSCSSLQQLVTTLDKALAQPGEFRLGSGESTTATARHAGWLIDLLVADRGDDRPLPHPRTPSAGLTWPDVTVIVAVRDRPELVRTTVRRVTAQDYPGTVVTLVVHDGDEPDHSLATSNRTRPVRGLRAPRGHADARVTGALAARTELVAFCDAGDTWLPHKLRTQVEVLRAEPETEAVCCGVRAAGESDAAVLARTSLTFADLLSLSPAASAPHPSTLLVRRYALVYGCGALHERAPSGHSSHDDLLLRLARRAPVRNIPEANVRVPARPRTSGRAQWRANATALRRLLARHPEFRLVPRGLARLCGRIAVAEAAVGRRGAALEWTIAALCARPREPHAYLALALTCGLPARVAARALRGRV
ncbi:glycosyltransferase [Halostreptopolyspora alba]|uniref:Glycosyltransferase n=2 Tax=Halostreptopolyspora alba TaxID=2487137 RepID=A0A3N0E4V8_9ACTN|nr:glycosyltransferase [Nocardiopsaceae bacterium YIM 96095]